MPCTMQSIALNSVTFEKDVDKALKGNIRRTGMYKKIKHDGCAQEWGHGDILFIKSYLIFNNATSLRLFEVI